VDETEREPLLDGAADGVAERSDAVAHREADCVAALEGEAEPKVGVTDRDGDCVAAALTEALRDSVPFDLLRACDTEGDAPVSAAVGDDERECEKEQPLSSA
jgi:hypothetical protein